MTVPLIRQERCADCHAVRPVDDMLVCWERRDPDTYWFLCRPSLEVDGIPPGRCLRQRSGPSSAVGIASATAGVPESAGEVTS